MQRENKFFFVGNNFGETNATEKRGRSIILWLSIHCSAVLEIHSAVDGIASFKSQFVELEGQDVPAVGLLFVRQFDASLRTIVEVVFSFLPGLQNGVQLIRREYFPHSKRVSVLFEVDDAENQFLHVGAVKAAMENEAWAIAPHHRHCVDIESAARHGIAFRNSVTIFADE